MSLDKYEVVIGLEVHAQLSTKSKIFSWSSAAFGADPNTATDPVCLGLPGTLPVLNQAAVESAVRLGLAAKCKIRARCRFSRKHYFYPDLPKGFQISQFDEPICEGGAITFRLRGERRSVRLVRIHLEEDAGKNLHAPAEVSFVDYNRAGVPLCEIVSEPDIRSAEEAAEYVRAVRALVRYLGICDGNMEEGSLRCDANVSLRLHGAAAYGTKTELKNMNSFKNVRDAIEHEVKRQAALLDRGERIIQETRLWDAARGVSAAMRSKEQAHDYRYFPEPDLPPLEVTPAMVQAARADLPELPADRQRRYEAELGLNAETARLLAFREGLGPWFERGLATGAAEAQPLATWITQDLAAALGGADPAASKVEPEALAALVGMVNRKEVTASAGKAVLEKLAAEGGDPKAIVEAEGLGAMGDGDELEGLVQAAIDANPDAAEKIRAGKQQAVGAIIGHVMRETKGRADGGEVSRIVREKLGV